MVVRLVMGLIEDEGAEIRRWRDREVEEMGKWKRGCRCGLAGAEEMVGQGHQSGGQR